MLNRLRGAFALTSGPLRKKVILFAALLATIPVLIMGASAYYISSGKMIDEIGEASSQTMLQIQQRIDEKMITMEKVALQNAVNPTLTRFLSLSAPEEDIENFGLTMTLLNSIQVMIEDIDSVYLYRPDKHLVVSPNKGMLDESVLPEYLREAVDQSPQAVWLDHKWDSQLVREGFHQITYIRRINASGNANLTAGYLIINLNDTVFFRVFSDMSLGARELVIVTPSGNVFSDLQRSLLKENWEHYSFIEDIMDTDADELLITREVDGRKLSINSLKSGYNGWKYVTVIPYNELTQHLQKIKVTMLLICLLLVVVSILATGLFSKSWYRTLQSLLDFIKNKRDGAEAQKGLNEFAVIRHYFETLQESNDVLGRQIEESMPLLRMNFIQQMLTEPFQASMLERAEYYQLPMKHPYYTVICIELDNMRGQTEKDVNLFHYAVINIAKEIISRHAEGLVVRMHSGHIAVLLNHDAEEVTLQDLKASSFQVSEEIRTIAESLLSITVTLGIGNSYLGLEQARSSYREALEALEYQLVEGSGRVLYIGQIKPGAASFSYPYEIEQQIITYLKLANLPKIHSLLDDFAHALRTEIFKHEHVRLSFAQLISVSLRTLFELDPNSSQLHEYNLYQRLNEMNASDRIVHWLKAEVYPPIVEHISIRTTQRNHSTIQKVLDYIHQYYDTDLSQSLAAGLISIPVSQFSHMFKSEVGMTFSDYIIAYRMEQARVLLQTTDMKISDIADKLRYNNSQNFIRVFKKVNGITPGEYRLRSAKSQSEEERNSSG